MNTKQLFFAACIIPFLTACGSSNQDASYSSSLSSVFKSEDKKKDEKEKDEDKKKEEENSNGGNQTTLPNSTNYTLTAWNDLGMHCMDGNDFSVFSVLPPYNNIHAQIKDKNGDLITSGITLTYESIQGTDSKLNTSSADKTNFWDYVTSLFGVTLQPNVGLTGNPTSSKTPANMTFNTTHKWWEAEGIPITPYNDDGSKNYYPLVKVVAKDNRGNILAEAKTVLPVSDEMDCKRCHASNSQNDAKPNSGWVNDTDSEKDYKYNILRLHDQKEPNAVSNNITALKAKGYNYDTKGLEATARAGTPILCAACHKSNALPNVGIGWNNNINIPPFTQAIHSKHALVDDPKNNMTLNNSNNRSACYACHPGSETACLRGAMGDAKNPDGTNQMQCQSCHGNMSNVGDKHREGWFDEPNCQACHYDGKRETSAVLADGTLRAVLDKRFATNPNTPAPGISLYRYSKGHGDLQCESCHGSTHAIYPAHAADNLLSEGIQGHSGTIAECSACHSSVPKTVTGGPHGMHPVGDAWVKDHEDVAEKNPSQCTVCHGADYRGTPLSKMWTSRTLKVEHGTKTFPKGHQVSCYDCHNGPNGD
jgi:hypothetical protein